MMKKTQLACFLFVAAISFSCDSGKNNGEEPDSETQKQEAPIPDIVTETVVYKIDSLSMHGYLAYDASLNGKRPAVLVVPEWWGLNEYAKQRARQLAEIGYVAMAVDMYGNGEVAENPGDAKKLAGPFYGDPRMAKKRIDAALERVRSNELTDDGNVAAIGYCFGGGMLLNVAKLGTDMKGIVSFHGNLAGIPPQDDLSGTQILVLHGEADKFVDAQQVARFKAEMDSIGADYTFIGYPGATHAFTNPGSTETGKKFDMPIEYNPAADTASWNEMELFLKDIFQR